MKYNAYIKKAGQPDEAAWCEDFEFIPSEADDPQKVAQAMVDYFNSTLHAGETARALVRVEPFKRKRKPATKQEEVWVEEMDERLEDLKNHDLIEDFKPTEMIGENTLSVEFIPKTSAIAVDITQMLDSLKNREEREIASGLELCDIEPALKKRLTDERNAHLLKEKDECDCPDASNCTKEEDGNGDMRDYCWTCHKNRSL